MAKKNKKRPTLAQLIACRSLKAIIALFRKYTIKGKLGSGASCPMFNFVEKTGTKLSHVNGDGSAKYNDPNSIDELWGEKSVTILRPSKVRTLFIDEFDNGRLPEFENY